MATTRLMPLHTGKGRTVGQAISAIIDYTENPQKTDGGRLITSWQCDSRIADAEFLFTKNQYIQKTGRVRGEDDVIAYHLRQSFVPGEITPEDANRLGCELAKRFTKGNHAYLTMVTGLVGGLLADVILKKADYKSAKSTVLSCGVFSIWVFGNFAPIFLNRESYMVMLTEGYGAEYAATLNTYMPMWIAPILLVACFVFGLVGGMIGKAICKKHFQRAGIA